MVGGHGVGFAYFPTNLADGKTHDAAIERGGDGGDDLLAATLSGLAMPGARLYPAYDGSRADAYSSVVYPFNGGRF